jgi:superfamily I DNA/RNA helicase
MFANRTTSVLVMALHKSKGKDFEAVVIVESRHDMRSCTKPSPAAP